jgi:hypothetical protein
MLENFRGLRKCSSGHQDYLGPEENSPRRRAEYAEKRIYEANSELRDLSRLCGQSFLCSFGCGSAALGTLWLIFSTRGTVARRLQTKGPAQSSFSATCLRTHDRGTLNSPL